MTSRHPWLLRVGLIAVACLCGDAPALAQDEAPRPGLQSRSTFLGSISGRVLLPSGHPINERIRITLSTADDPGMQTYTDSNGNFSYNRLPEGNYTLEVAADTKIYEPLSESVRLMRSARLTVNIYLREKARSRATAGNVVSLAELDQQVPAPAKKEYEKATALLREGKLQDGIERLKQAIAICPDYLVARNDLGAQYLKLNRLAEAVEQFEAAIELNAKAFNPRLNLGIALVRQRKYGEAMDHLNLATSMDGSSAAAHLYIGIVSAETDELDRGARELALALSLGGNEYSVAHFYAAVVHMKKGEREVAVRELKTYLEGSPVGEEVARARQMLEKLKQ